MPLAFKNIGLIGKHPSTGVLDTLRASIAFLQTCNVALFIESETAMQLDSQELTPELTVVKRQELGSAVDLLIVIGGDGSLLNAAHAVTLSGTPVLGINRGRLGFLTDIHPNELDTKVGDVLAGNYIQEARFMLEAENIHAGISTYKNNALNDVVLLPGDAAQMIEFTIYIDEQFVCSQRADGLIIATPTGSTAYALSGGGPILHPGLDAVTLVPMFPHTLSSRPIVVDSDSSIKIEIAENNRTAPRISCDGQDRASITPGDMITIKKHPQALHLIHPNDYNYFETLRVKLHWGGKPPC